MKDPKREIIEQFATSLQKNNIHIEFKNPTDIENCLSEFSEHLLRCKINLTLKNNVSQIISVLDVASKSIVETSALVRSDILCISEYSQECNKNLEILKQLFGQCSVIDVRSECLITWSKNNIFDRRRHTSIEYFYNSDSRYKNRIFFKDEYDQYTCECNVCDVSYEENILYSSKFYINSNKPRYHRFAFKVDDKLSFNFYKYREHTNFILFCEIIKNIFLGKVLSFQRSSSNENFISFEFKVPIKDYETILSIFGDSEIFNSQIKFNFSELNIPDIIDYVSFIFSWKNKDEFSVKIAAITENRDAIRSILGVDDL